MTLTADGRTSRRRPTRVLFHWERRQRGAWEEIGLTSGAVVLLSFVASFLLGGVLVVVLLLSVLVATYVGRARIDPMEYLLARPVSRLQLLRVRLLVWAVPALVPMLAIAGAYVVSGAAWSCDVESTEALRLFEESGVAVAWDPDDAGGEIPAHEHGWLTGFLMTTAALIGASLHVACFPLVGPARQRSLTLLASLPGLCGVFWLARIAYPPFYEGQVLPTLALAYIHPGVTAVVWLLWLLALLLVAGIVWRRGGVS